jgi:hypothetical protein
MGDTTIMIVFVGVGQKFFFIFFIFLAKGRGEQALQTTTTTITSPTSVSDYCCQYLVILFELIFAPFSLFYRVSLPLFFFAPG